MIWGSASARYRANTMLEQQRGGCSLHLLLVARLARATHTTSSNKLIQMPAATAAAAAAEALLTMAATAAAVAAAMRLAVTVRRALRVWWMRSSCMVVMLVGVLAVGVQVAGLLPWRGYSLTTLECWRWCRRHCNCPAAAVAAH